MKATNSDPDWWTTEDGHKHKFHIDPEGAKAIMMAQGIYWLNDEREPNGFSEKVWFTCDHFPCRMYLSLDKKVVYPTMIDNRLPECVKQWPECQSFAFNPACCRFPKSCSAGYKI